MSTIVRAKFVINSITQTTYGKTLDATAVYSTEGENASFSKATPFGQFKLQVDKDTVAAGLYNPGDFIYLDISIAPAK